VEHVAIMKGFKECKFELGNKVRRVDPYIWC